MGRGGRGHGRQVLSELGLALLAGAAGLLGSEPLADGGLGGDHALHGDADPALLDPAVVAIRPGRAERLFLAAAIHFNRYRSRPPSFLT